MDEVKLDDGFDVKEANKETEQFHEAKASDLKLLDDLFIDYPKEGQPAEENEFLDSEEPNGIDGIFTGDFLKEKPLNESDDGEGNNESLLEKEMKLSKESKETRSSPDQTSSDESLLEKEMKLSKENKETRSSPDQTSSDESLLEKEMSFLNANNDTISTLDRINKNESLFDQADPFDEETIESEMKYREKNSEHFADSKGKFLLKISRF